MLNKHIVFYISKIYFSDIDINLFPLYIDFELRTANILKDYVITLYELILLSEI